MNKDEFDAIVIGSGAGGGACLWSLVNHGLNVCLLEAGPAYDFSKDYRLHLPEWETENFPKKIDTKNRQTFARLQSLEPKWSELLSWNHQFGRFNSGTRRRPFAYHHVLGLGGTTLHFAGEAHRMNPQSMKMKTRFSVAADWPVTYEELEPYYQQAETLVGVAGLNNDTVRWRSKPYPLPAHNFNYGSQRLKAGCESLGLNLTANSLAILSEPYDGRPGCNHCNNCVRGCPRSDKGSVDVTYIKKVQSKTNCTIKTEANVTHIEADKNDRVSAVYYQDSSGNEFRVKAKTIIIACGAVETPRLLLNSGNPSTNGGLANESGQLGQNFMETLSRNSSGIFSEPLGSHRGIPSDSICWDFNHPDAIEDVIGGCRFSSSVAETGLIGPIAYANRVVEGWGYEHKQKMRDTFGKVLTIGAIGESLPNRQSFIDLDANEKDKFGQPKARINSYLGEMELKRLSFMMNTCRAIINASGAEKIFEEYGSYDFFSATHVFGTCRMGNDPEDSVVNRYGQSHRWKNLFITDASVFPSSGGGEAPSLTIEALAIRTADHIADLLKKRII